ncbi:hypothetical protein [Nostoc sp.]|uniref:hypothetical protein n=1 Tax=Nostoc sp. TaxID=1180 RepID=UPI002FF5AC78
MTQGLNQVVQTVQKSQGQRCSPRDIRPRLKSFFPYLNQYFTEESYSFTDSNANRYRGKMGKRMEVILLPGASNITDVAWLGTAPRPNALEPISKFLRESYLNYGFIKGHMWNQGLGGKGETYNLVPLTSKANSAHKNNVETPLKGALENFASFYQRNNDQNHPDYKLVYGFKYVVKISDDKWDKIQEGVVPDSIYVQLFPIKSDQVGNITPTDNSIINEINPLIRDEIDRLVNREIEIDQDGDVF